MGAAFSGITLVLPAQVLHATAAQVQQQLQQIWQDKSQAQAADAVRCVTVDAAQLHLFDSSVVAVLLALARRARQQACKFAIINPTPRLKALAKVYGFEDLAALHTA